MNKRYGNILIVSVTILVLCFVAAASATTWSVDGSGGDADFTGIQDAINNATDGDTILVHFGVYYENVVVNKSVTLIGNGQPVVDAGGEGNAITLTADGTTLEGFTATKAGSSWQDTDAGITLISNNNTITGNNVCNNNRGGIELDDSSNNTIYFNNFINNTDNVYFYTSINIWNSPFEITYTYDGTTYKSYVGNYWSDYNGTDAEGDGIGDTNYSIDSEEDESDVYPLMQPFENYNISTSAYT